MLDIFEFTYQIVNKTQERARVAHVPMSLAFVDKNHRSNQILIEDFKFFLTL